MTTFALSGEVCDIIRMAAPHMVSAVRRALPGAGAGVVLDQHRDELEAELVAMVLRLVEDLARRKVRVLVSHDGDVKVTISD
jgi:ABC-type histidine transport system ATPase subunit